MADKDDFMFDEEDKSGFDSEPGPEEWGDYEPEKKKGSKRLVYLLLLLLVLAFAAVYVLILAPEDGPSPPINVVSVKPKLKAAPMPKPIAAPIPATESASGGQSGTTAEPISAPAAGPTAPETATRQTEPTQDNAAPAVTVVPVTAAPATPATPAVAPLEPKSKSVEVVPSKSEVALVKPEPFVPQPTTSVAAEGLYTLSAGAFLMQSSVDDVLKRVRKLGYEARIQKIKRKVDMTRLLVGVYPEAAAAQKLHEVKKITPDAFSLNKGDKIAVYAGSYLVLDKARIFADTTLIENGIRVTEEGVQIDQTLQRVTFGSFANREEALKISRKVAGQGLVATPVKK
ncbi:MAG: SPOR domain-containing protein [Desulfuromonadales bacterium]|nr:SPOR domain-containing protein [Desulfuromonadales bacterium]